MRRKTKLAGVVCVIAMVICVIIITQMKRGEEKSLIASFEQAEKVRSWFSAYAEIGMDDSQTVQAENGYYARVEQNNLTTEDSLSNYLHQYFDDSICKDLMNIKVQEDLPLFIEKQDVLYYFAGYRGLLDYSDGTRSYDVRINKDGSADLILTYEILLYDDQMINLDITYQAMKLKDGNWQFAGHFELPIERAVALYIG